jgi:hypothetical protein
VLTLSRNFSKVFLRKVRKEEYMDHESGNEIESDLRKKPARTKGRGVHPIVYLTEADGESCG